jgi:hypothetical protein
MATEKEGQSIRDYGNRKKRIRRIRRIIIFILLLALAIAGVVYVYRLYNKIYKGYEVINTIDNAVGNEVKYLRYKDSVVKYSKDGATAIARDGKLLWSGSYEMNKPTADTCGDYIVIADIDGKSLQLFDKKGAVGTISTIYNIVKAEVASQGVVAVLMEDEDSNYITVYDKDGTSLQEIKTSMMEDGYPIDISLSEDGKKLVTNYLSINNGELTGITTFYNFGEVGKNWTDGIMGSHLFEGIIAPKVVFNNNDSACVFKEKGFLLFRFKEEPGNPIEVSFEQNIKSIFYNKSSIGVILEGGEAGYNELVLYNLDGKKILDKKINFNYNNIYMTEREIIMYDNLSCIIMRMNGAVKFSCTFDTNISALYPINDIDRYFLMSGSQIKQISLVE